MKFAVIETGGKQYKVLEGDSIKIEKLSGENKEGSKITFDQVVLFDDGSKTELGAPYVSGKKVEGKFLKEERDKKIRIQKFKSKSNYDKIIGHRQTHSFVEITKI